MITIFREIITAGTAFKADVFALGVSVIELVYLFIAKHKLTPLSVVKEKDFYSSIRTGKIPKSCAITPFIRPLLEVRCELFL